jgi:hypothetical protein
LEKLLSAHARIEISDERFDLMRKLLPRSSRRIGDPLYCKQCLHPVVDYLIHKEIRLKGKPAVYMPRNLPAGFARCSTGYDALFKAVCEDTLARMSSGAYRSV